MLIEPIGLSRGAEEVLFFKNEKRRHQVQFENFF